MQETLHEKGSSETADNKQGGITVDDETTKNENTNVEEISSGTQVETLHNQNNEQAGQDSIAQDDTSEICAFKIEKPKMPRFHRDVRDYAIFKSDFTHIIGTKYNNRDAITLLRSALTGKPLEMIKGIGLDYSAAWDYLYSVYGDPRFVADTVTQDIMKFMPLQNEEDSCFCELVHLIRRSYNALKELGRPQDMDNNHILAIIEQKMCNDDRKVWARHLEREKVKPKLMDLIEWVTAEMKSRMQATAPLRNVGKLGIHHLAGEESNRTKQHKCWICKSYDHWVEQCLKFTSMTPNERVKIITDNHACYSCLKKAGRDHRASNCS